MRVGLVGVGYIGIHHLRNFSRLREEGYIDSIAVADIDSSKKRLVDKIGGKFYNDYLSLLDDEDIDLISIATPTETHTEIAVEAIRRGIHTLIEKPVSNNINDVYRIRELADKNDVIVMAGHIERFNPAVIRLKKLIDEDGIGNIISLASRRLGGPRLINVGVIFDLAIHDIDIMIYLVNNNVKNVYARAIKRLPEVSNEDYAVLLINFEEGVIGRVEVSRITPVKIRELDVNASKCYIRLNYLEQSIMIIESFLEKGPASWSSFREFIKKFSPVARELDVEREEPLYIELKSFIKAVEKRAPPPVSLDDAIKVMEVAFAAERSYLSNKIVNII
jgi:UDP-N-acetylglucosamine 3-dehydrogenase